MSVTTSTIFVFNVWTTLANLFAWKLILFRECLLFHRRCSVLSPGLRLQTCLFGSWFFSQNVVCSIDDVWCKHHGYACNLFIWQLYSENVCSFINDIWCYHLGYPCNLFVWKLILFAECLLFNQRCLVLGRRAHRNLFVWKLILYPECRLFHQRWLVLARRARLQTCLFGSWFFSQNVVYFIDDVWCKHHGYACNLFIWKLFS